MCKKAEAEGGGRRGAGGPPAVRCEGRQDAGGMAGGVLETLPPLVELHCLGHTFVRTHSFAI
jgi:hypothetical protein